MIFFALCPGVKAFQNKDYESIGYSEITDDFFKYTEDQNDVEINYYLR